MSKDEIKYEISKVLDNFSDQALEQLLLFLKQLESNSNAAQLNPDDIQRIISEDRELLQKLAQ